MKALFVSLGCDKNTVDSEKIFKRYVDKYGFEICLRPEEADVVIINTCSFIRDAKKESVDYIKYFVRLKKEGFIKKILVLGCLVSLNDKTHEYDKLFDDVDKTLSIENYIEELDYMNDRMVDVLSFSSSLKICDGCDKFCSYCIIPYLRGRFKSVDEKSLIEETKKLARNGVKELSIVGQDILHYGIDKDIYDRKEKPIVHLIDEISKIDGIEWIRLLYCYPEEIDDSVINLIKKNEKVLPYIDMPIQHINNRILKLMNRKTSKESIKNIIGRLRSEIKDICIRTTLIVGFPSETDDEFEELVDFVREIEFDKLGVFTYSREKLSKSYDFDNQISENVKKYRKKKILDTQKKIVDKKNKEKIGIVYNSIVEGRDIKNGFYIVRPYFDARNIDDKVYVKTDENLISGSFVNVEIKSVKGYNLIGELI